ncbi:unnamed protein product, partial [Schistocephalus solidus]|uniref:Protein kinase domain-containing protein n=1 Tax=Schistocephalus solidus TaxID=70667 RepID=A0A183THA8_SCHSO
MDVSGGSFAQPLLLLLLVGRALLADGSSFEKSRSPFDPRLMTFITTQGAYPGHPVFLRCAFNAESPVGMTGEISFVHASYLPSNLRRRPQDAYSFGLPPGLERAHEDHGRILNVTYVNTSVTSAGFQVTARFLMNREREGSYLCKITPHAVLINLHAMREEAFLTMTPSPLVQIITQAVFFSLSELGVSNSIVNAKNNFCLGTIYAVSTAAFLSVCLATGFLCWHRRLLSRHTFKRVCILRPARGHLESTKDGAPAAYRPPEILVHPEKRPVMRSLLLLLAGCYGGRKPLWAADFQGGCGSVNSLLGHSPLQSDTTDVEEEEEDYVPMVADHCSSEVKTKINYLKNSAGGRLRSNQTLYLLPMDPEFEIPASNIRLCGILGEGAFGTVFKATVRDLPRGSGVVGCIEAAIKTLKDGLADADVEDFVQEIQTLKYIGRHSNVIRLYATSTQHGSPCLSSVFTLHFGR